MTSCLGISRRWPSRSCKTCATARRARSAARFAWAWAASLWCLAGCQPIETRFDILSFSNPKAPEVLTERFEPGAFSLDARNNLDIVFEIPMTQVAVPRAADGAATPTTSPDDETVPQTQGLEQLWMAQTVHIHVFWMARPGTTYAESSQTNASILYCLMMQDSAISYEGAGFVYVRRSRDGKTITGEVESASLVPVRTSNEPVDVFGPCQFRGTFVAREDRRQVVDVLRDIRVRLGRPLTPREVPVIVP